MKHHLTIDEETMTVLRASTITEVSLSLPAGQLPRPLYEKVNKVLVTAGGKWNRQKGAHIFPSDPREVLGLALEKGAILDTKKATQAFYTPAGVAAHLVELADVEGHLVLEPSAGRGALAKACQNARCHNVTCIELDPKSVDALCLGGYEVIAGDFLGMASSVKYGRVVMNPPFTAGQDIAHVTHAFNEFLGTGGILVAIMGRGWTFATNRKSAAFRDLVTAHGEIVDELPEDTFRESGTSVATLIVRLRKQLT